MDQPKEMESEFPGYENSMKELESILQKLEASEIDMDEISILVKRASFLIENCQNKLRNIETELGEEFESE